MPNKFAVKRLAIATKLVRDLRREHGRNIHAVGVTGSVARGKAEQYSDIDMEIIVKRPSAEPYQARIVDDIYCSLTLATRRDALLEITLPHPDLPERLGGFTKIRKLYDPAGFLETLEDKANRVPSHLFHKSAELALLQSYEDFCRVKNAYLNGDERLLRDNVNYVTHSASWIVASLNNSHFGSDREVFKAYKRLSKLPRGFERIEHLRYGHLPRRKLLQRTISFYLDLVDFCEENGILFPVDKKELQSLAGR